MDRSKAFSGILFLFLALSASLTEAQLVYAELRAFPTAEGFGAYTTGGRGGRVIHVTNLNDSGPGSFRDAVTQSGPRTVVFDLSGTIILKSNLTIKNGDLTIAGQTAPGDGITIRGSQSDYGPTGGGMVTFEASNVIVRYVRFRRGLKAGEPGNMGNDSLQIRSGPAIFDHISASWGGDETVDVTLSQAKTPNLTIQWSLIAEALSTGGHAYLWRMGGHETNTPSRMSVHHNLSAHGVIRFPNMTTQKTPAGFTVFFDYRNNVRYNWKQNASRISNEQANAPNVNLLVNFVRNKSIPGPTTDAKWRNVHSRINNSTGKQYVQIYQDQNLIGNDDLGWAAFLGQEHFTMMSAPLNVPSKYAISMDDVNVAYQRVLDSAGASFPKRDAVDQRIVNDVINGTGGIPNLQTSVGGWPTLRTYDVKTDTDRDGMPDAWETDRGLNPNNENDFNGDDDGDGYTNLEEYLNWLVGEGDSGTPLPGSPPGAPRNLKYLGS